MLICFGSPMLDIITNVGKQFLKKYSITEDAAVRVDQKNKEVFKEIFKMKPIILPGGSVTNTVRVFQWACKRSDRIIFVGTIGKDKAGDVIKKRLDEEKINYHFVEIAESTGKCAVLITPEGSRSLIADLGASKIFTVQDMDDVIWNSVRKSNLLYISTFFISVSVEVMRIVIKHFTENNKKVVVNLGSCYLCEKYPKEVEFLVENANIVVGNSKEFRTFTKHPKRGSEDINEILRDINKKYLKKNDRILLVTNGDKPIIVLNGDKILEFPVKPLKAEHVVDTNGAGDAFIGGFLAKFVENESLENCIKCGTLCSKVIVQNHGCSFENKKIFDDYKTSFY